MTRNHQTEVFHEICLGDLTKIITSFLRKKIEKKTDDEKNDKNEEDWIVDVSFWAFKWHWKESSAYLLSNMGLYHQHQNQSSSLSSSSSSSLYNQILFSSVLELLHLPSFYNHSDQSEYIIQGHHLSKFPGYFIQNVWNICIIYTLYCLYGNQKSSTFISVPIIVSINQILELRMAVDKINICDSKLGQDISQIYQFMIMTKAFVVSENIESGSFQRMKNVYENHIANYDKDNDSNSSTSEYHDDSSVNPITFRFVDAVRLSSQTMIQRINKFQWVHSIEHMLQSTKLCKQMRSSIEIVKIVKTLSGNYRSTMEKELLPNEMVTTSTTTIQTFSSSSSVDIPSFRTEIPSTTVKKHQVQNKKRLRLNEKFMKLLGPTLPITDQSISITSKQDRMIEILSNQRSNYISDALHYQSHLSDDDNDDDDDGGGGDSLDAGTGLEEENQRRSNAMIAGKKPIGNQDTTTTTTTISVFELLQQLESQTKSVLSEFSSKRTKKRGPPSSKTTRFSEEVEDDDNSKNNNGSNNGDDNGHRVVSSTSSSKGMDRIETSYEKRVRITRNRKKPAVSEILSSLEQQLEELAYLENT